MFRNVLSIKQKKRQADLKTNSYSFPEKYSKKFSFEIDYYYEN